MLGENHWSYLSDYKSTFDLFHSIVAYIHLLLKGGIGSSDDSLSGTRIFVRPGTTDLPLYKEIFVSKEYEIYNIKERQY